MNPQFAEIDRMLENDAHYLETLARFDVTMPDARAHKFKNIACRLRDLAAEIQKAESAAVPAVREPVMETPLLALSNVELQAAIESAFDKANRGEPLKGAKDHYAALLEVQAARARLTAAIDSAFRVNKSLQTTIDLSLSRAD